MPTGFNVKELIKVLQQAPDKEDLVYWIDRESGEITYVQSVGITHVGLRLDPVLEVHH